MIPYSYQMVNMGGIDLAEANGTVVEGLYNRLALARNACGDLILYNWKFADIEIVPSPCSTIDVGTSILINGAIQVTEQDLVTVPGINPDPPEPPEPPVLVPIEITENGEYDPADYDAVGVSSVKVNVEETGSEAVVVATRTIGGTDASLWAIYNSGQPIAIFYRDVMAGAYRDVGFVRIMYNTPASQSPDGVAHSGWCEFALSNCVSEGVNYSQNQLIKEWAYDVIEYSLVTK